MSYKLDHMGRLIGPDGNPVADSTGAPIKVDGAVDQELMNRKMGELRTTLSSAADKARMELIAEHEAKLAKLEPTSQEAEELRAQVTKLEGELHSRETLEKQRLEAAKSASAAETAEWRKRAELREKALKQTMLRAACAEAAVQQAATFNNPEDLYLFVRDNVEWTEATNEAGVPTGQFTYAISMQVMDPELKKLVPKKVNAQEAAIALAQQRPYLVKGTGASGFGGGSPGRPGEGNGKSDQLREDASPRDRLVAGFNDPANQGREISSSGTRRLKPA